MLFVSSINYAALVESFNVVRGLRSVIDQSLNPMTMAYFRGKSLFYMAITFSKKIVKTLAYVKGSVYLLQARKLEYNYFKQDGINWKQMSCLSI